MMNNTNPIAYLQQIAARLNDQNALTDLKDIEMMLDEVESLNDNMDPEVREGAERLMMQLRARLESLT